MKGYGIFAHSKKIFKARLRRGAGAVVLFAVFKVAGISEGRAVGSIMCVKLRRGADNS